MLLSELRSLRASLPQPRSGLAQALPSQPAPPRSLLHLPKPPPTPIVAARAVWASADFRRHVVFGFFASSPAVAEKRILADFRRGPRFGARRPSLKASLLPLEFPEKRSSGSDTHTHTHTRPHAFESSSFPCSSPFTAWGTQQQRDSPFFCLLSRALWRSGAVCRAALAGSGPGRLSAPMLA